MKRTGTMHGGTNRRAERCTLAIAASLLAILCRADDAKHYFDIPAGPAVERLAELFTKLKMNNICDYAATGGATTNAVRGMYTLQEALEKMAQGKNIKFTMVNERTVACGPRDEPKQEVPRTAPQADRSDRNRDDDTSVVEQVVVTGTHIRKQSPNAAQVVTYGEEELRQSGFTTLPDVLRTLPQNFDGGPTEDTEGIGRETPTNSARGIALNIRGLGPGETLILVNGRRIAPGGTEGAFVDVSSIPLSAVEAIDFLTDSGSALYGSDAIGGVINIRLKRTFSGAETQARFGATTDGALHEYQFNQTVGGAWTNGDGLVSFDLYRRGALPARERPQAQSDLRRFGGDNFDTLQSNPGTLLAGGIPWAIPRGQDGSKLTPSDFTPGTVNLEDLHRDADLLPVQKRWSLLASGHYTPTAAVDLFADTLFAQRNVDFDSPGLRAPVPVTILNPFYVNPAGGTDPIVVLYDFLEDLGPLRTDVILRTLTSAAGVSVDLGSKWRIVPYLSYAREEQRLRQRGQVNLPALVLALMDPNPQTAFNPLGDGSHTNPATLAALRSESSFEANSAVAIADVTADGPLLLLPAGALKLALGVNHRREAFNSALRSQASGSHSNGSLSRDVSALFGEILIPLAGDDYQRQGLRQLELSLAYRVEDYADVGSTTAPKFGVLWSPLQGVTLLGTWTESFRAPNLADLFEGNNGSAIQTVLDATAPAGMAQALVWFGKNSDLRPEAASSWTLGAKINPPWLSAFSIALTYFDIQVENGFKEYSFSFDLLGDPRFASLVTRNPTAAQRQLVCSNSTFSGVSPGDCLTAPVGALIDLRLGNSALLATSGFDLIAHHEFDNRLGHFELGMNGTYVLRFAQAQTATSPLIELVDTQNNPLRLRARGSATWQYRGLSASAFVNFAGGYRDVASHPHRSVDSWTTFDGQLRYDLEPAGGGWLAGMGAFINAQNVFDRDPPFLNNQLGIGYDAENADLQGRFVSVGVVKHW